MLIRAAVAVFVALFALVPTEPRAAMLQSGAGWNCVSGTVNAGDVDYVYYDCMRTFGGGGVEVHSSYEIVGGGESGNADPDWSLPTKGTVPDNAQNSEDATCQTELPIRWTHALQDVNAYYVSRRFTNPMRAGAYTVQYDDGGTEVWWFTGSAGGTAVFPVPKPGSLTCP